MTVRYAKGVANRIQVVYDDPRLEILADRLEELLDLLETNPGDNRLRKHRMQNPPLWLVIVRGSGEEFSFLWSEENGDPWIHWAAFGTI